MEVIIFLWGYSLGIIATAKDDDTIKFGCFLMILAFCGYFLMLYVNRKNDSKESGN